jgi:hypothetical protein
MLHMWEAGTYTWADHGQTKDLLFKTLHEEEPVIRERKKGFCCKA